VIADDASKAGVLCAMPGSISAIINNTLAMLANTEIPLNHSKL
jgi:hypothetical protein